MTVFCVRMFVRTRVGEERVLMVFVCRGEAIHRRLVSLRDDLSDPCVMCTTLPHDP